MSAIIVGVAKVTFGLLSKKARAYGAEKLQNGGLADKQFRSFIVGELDDIKYRLNAISRRELKNGISCFNRGISRLHVAFSDLVDGPANQSSTKPSSNPTTGIEDVITRARDAVERTESKPYTSAEESFKDAARDAGKAFNNDDLSIEDRILACTVLISSAILEHLNYPKLAVSDCIGYLKELNALPAIFEIFNVYATGGIKSIINKERRAKIVESVIEINLFVLNFITKFTTEGKNYNCFDWPLIRSDTDTRVYHPMYYEFMVKEPTNLIPPWCIRGLLHFDGHSAVNSKGDILLCRRYDRRCDTRCFLAKRHRKTTETCDKLKELELWSIPALEKIEDIKCNYLAVDEDDTVYLLTRYGQKNRYDLSVCDSEGNVIHHPSVECLEFLTGKECRCFGITKDKRLVFCCQFKVFEQNDHIIYVCDRSGQLKNSFPVHISDKRVVKEILNSNSTEIVLVTVKEHNTKSKSVVLYFYSEDGRSERENVRLTLADSGPPSSCTVRYDYRANNFICLASSTTFRVWKYLRFTEDGELLQSCNLSMYMKQLGFKKPNLSSHPNGSVALICHNGAMFM